MKYSTQPYQYKATDGQKFSTREDKDRYQEQLMEKKALQQEESHCDDLDRVPTWIWPDEDNTYNC
jgi:hypothetical protein